MSVDFLPAVRGLLAADDRLPRLTLAAADTDGSLGLPSGAAPQAVAEALRPYVSAGAAETVIPGIGRVTAACAARPGRVAGKVAMVTGAGAGIGRAVSLRLAERGAVPAAHQPRERRSRRRR